MWSAKRRRCIEGRKRRLAPASPEQKEQQRQEEKEELAAVASGWRSPPRSSMNVGSLLPGEISAMRGLYLRKRFDPPKYNFAETLKRRTSSAASNGSDAPAAPLFAATHHERLQSLVVDLDDFDHDAMMWEPPEKWGKWSSVPLFDPVVMPRRRPGSAYAAIVDSTVRNWRLQSFEDHGRLHKIKQHSQDQEKFIQKELLQETLRREKITGVGRIGRQSRRPSAGRSRGRRKRSDKIKGHTNQDVIRAIDQRLSELDQARYLMNGYEREQAGMRRRPMTRKTTKLKKKKKKKKKKIKQKTIVGEDDKVATLDSRTRRRKQRRQSLALEKIRKRRTLAITADDLAKSNIMREAFLESARRSVHADRAAFWVFDEAPFELWTFTAKGNAQVLRVAADTGIVGRCFTEGTAVIVHDAYKLRTFSAKMDRRTGYLTKSVLCIPCHGEDKVIEDEFSTNLGCVQLLNKKSEKGKFNLRDSTLVQLQLTILRAYIRKFQAKDKLDANVSLLSNALRKVRHETENADEESLKVRFVGLAKQYGKFDNADGKVREESFTDPDLKSDDEEILSEEEYVLGARNDFTGGLQSLIQSRNDVPRAQFMGSTSFLSSDVKTSDIVTESEKALDRIPWRSKSTPSF